MSINMTDMLLMTTVSASHEGLLNCMLLILRRRSVCSLILLQPC